MTTPENKKSHKILYSMGEVCEMFDVNPSLIRFWEKKFDILKPKKNAKGNRLFTVVDVENLKIIYHLVKERGLTLSGAEQEMREHRLQLRQGLSVIELLQRVRSTLVELKQELDSEESKTENHIIIQSQSAVPQIEQQTEISRQPYIEQTLF